MLGLHYDRDHQKKPSYLCQDCFKEYSRKDIYQKHFRKIHMNGGAGRIPEPSVTYKDKPPTQRKIQNPLSKPTSGRTTILDPSIPDQQFIRKRKLTKITPKKKLPPTLRTLTAEDLKDQQVQAILEIKRMIEELERNRATSNEKSLKPATRIPKTIEQISKELYEPGKEHINDQYEPGTPPSNSVVYTPSPFKKLKVDQTLSTTPLPTLQEDLECSSSSSSSCSSTSSNSSNSSSNSSTNSIKITRTIETPPKLTMDIPITPDYTRHCCIQDGCPHGRRFPKIMKEQNDVQLHVFSSNSIQHYGQVSPDTPVRDENPLEDDIIIID